MAVNRIAIFLALSFSIASTSIMADIPPIAPKKTATVDPASLPDWFKDSERLSTLLGGKAVGDVKDAKVIRRTPTPIEGLDAMVIEAMVIPPGGEGEPRKEIFVMYVDKTGRYMVAGLVVDMEEGRNLGQIIEREVRGEMADNPALALSPLEMAGVTAANPSPLEDAVMVVIDLGPDMGRTNLLAISKLYATLMEEGTKVAKLHIIPVSAGKHELSTGAMAMAMGYDDLQAGDGYRKLIEFAEKGKNTPWMDKKRLANSPDTKGAMGRGIFRLDNNSTQALLARLNTLPLVYRMKDGKLTYFSTPTSSEGWKAILTGH